MYFQQLLAFLICTAGLLAFNLVRQKYDVFAIVNREMGVTAFLCCHYSRDILYTFAFPEPARQQHHPFVIQAGG